MKSSILLLRTLLRSTSGINILKHSSDKKKKRRIIGNAIGVSIIYIMVMAYCIATCVGYGQTGMISAAPVLCALTISLIAFVFTLFKTNGYLFAFREYDMLMSLPFKSSTVAACKFSYMYIKSLLWYSSISVAMMIGYGYYARPAFYVYPVWLILSLILPVIPMLVASFFGFIIARISAGFRKTNIVQTILTFIFVIFCFSVRFIIERLFREEGAVDRALTKTADITGQAAKIYLPAGWFSDAVTKNSVIGTILPIVVSAALFAALFALVGRSYRKINSALKNHAASRSLKKVRYKQRPLVLTIAYKEWKRMSGSTVYMVNAGMGELLAAIVGLLTLIVGFDRFIGMFSGDAPFDHSVVYPAIPFIVYFFIGMVATTACSPSLEGKNYWIMQSLPIEKKTLYQGKMLFNIFLTVPFMTFATLAMCLSAKVPVLDAVLYLLLGVSLCAFSTAWGCVCGVKHMRLDWENEVEVIKQGSAVAIYMFPNMFVVMGLAALNIYLGMHMNHALLSLIFIAVYSLLAFLCYMRVSSLSKR